MEQEAIYNNKVKEGLTSTEVERSRAEHGENVLTPPKRTSFWRLYLEKYEDPIIRILLVAAVISLGLAVFSGEYVETIGIILAVLFATTVGFYFERDAAKKFDVLTALGEEQPVKVIRDGKPQQIARRDVVVGDVVVVETGDEIPADGRLFEATDLQVDESSLTGEQLTTKRIATSQAHHQMGTLTNSHSGGSQGSAYPEDLLLRSSMVMNGTGRIIITAVGDDTEIGHVARQATEQTGVKTPLNLQLNQLAKLISKVGTAVSVLAFVLFLAHDILTQPLWHTSNYIEMAMVVMRYFMMAVTLIVMAVPEGLPMAVTLALALNMRRMLQSNNLVRKLSASETMGAVTVICTDKTGTLTENRMTVSDVKCAKEEGNGEASEACFQQLYKAIALNTTAELDGDGKGIGNPTETALLRWTKERGADYAELRQRATITKRWPFSTERKYMATIADHTLYVKGAPEIVLSMCRLTEDQRSEIGRTLSDYQHRAMRTLAFAMKPVSEDIDNQSFEGLDFQGICAINDPLRQDVAQAVADCQRAGIEVKMVTGDTGVTAVEIGRQAGILPSSDTVSFDGVGHLTGTHFSELSTEKAKEAVRSLHVMSRARPGDKQRLVELLQQQGEVVAVTGDGTNDAPALNHAHVGLSLGSGTSVAKHASDITLIDDSFRSIVKAVMWGRSLYKNIQRFLFFQLVVNVTALLLVIGGSIIGTEMPLTVTQILWVNLIMDTFAAMALASLPPSREVMNEQPRKATDFIITPTMGWGIAIIGTLFSLGMLGYLWKIEHGGINTHELTEFFTVFVMLQWWNLFNAKMLGSAHSAFRYLYRCRGFLLVLAMILGGQWLIVTFGGEMFRTEPLPWQSWLTLFAATSPVMIIGELYRFLRRCSGYGVIR